MRKFFAVLGSAVFFVLAPGIVAGIAPWWITRRGLETSKLWWPLRGLGATLAASGGLVLLDSFVRFALQGLGTPAPVFPTRRLVITGLYRHVRNPMYVAVMAVILGQGLILGNVRVFEYGILTGLGFHLFVLACEEPTLRAKYGVEYESFCSGVPRWIPRLSPWHAHDPM